MYELMNKLGKPNYVYVSSDIESSLKNLIEPEQNDNVGVVIFNIGWIYKDYKILVSASEVSLMNEEDYACGLKCNASEPISLSYMPVSYNSRYFNYENQVGELKNFKEKFGI